MLHRPITPYPAVNTLLAELCQRIPPKKEAVAWAQDVLPERWARLARLAEANRNGTPHVRVNDVRDFIYDTAEHIHALDTAPATQRGLYIS